MNRDFLVLGNMENKRKIQIFIVDDHPIVREGLKSVIQTQHNLEVIGEAESTGEALRALNHVQPDLLIADVSLKHSSGLDLIKTLRKQHPQIKVLVLSVHDEMVYAKRVIKAGARGYLMKQYAISKINEAIRKVMKGEIYLSESVASKIITQYVRGSDGAEKNPLDILSDRELEVFQRLGRKLTIRQIAGELNISIKTVESYRANIKIKLDFNTAAQLSDFAKEWYQQESPTPPISIPE